MTAASSLAIASIAASAVGTGMSVIGQMQAGAAAKNQAAYQAAVARNNQILSERAAQDALLRGKQAEEQKRLETRRLIGQQRAVMAGNGVVIDQGSALDITSDTREYGELDALTTRYNAEREAYAARVQGANFAQEATLADMRGASASSSATFGAVGSLITGAGSVGKDWYNYKKEFGSPPSGGYNMPW